MKKINLIFAIIFGLFLSFGVAFAQEESTESSGIRERVQQKVEEALKKPKAYLGSVTDISENTIQIKSTSGEIRQITTDEENTTVVNTLTTAKTVTLEDVAIGDFIVAMGYKNGNDVLEASRILVSSPLETVTRKSFRAEVTSFAKNQGEAKSLKDGGEVTFKTDSSTRYQLYEDEEIVAGKATDVKEGSITILSGVIEDEVLTARRILVVSQAQTSQ